MDNTLGLILRARRKEKGLKLVDVSELSGLHTAHIGRIERGERFPTGRTLKKLAGFIPRDAADDRLDRFKKSVKKEIIETLVNLGERIDRL